MLEAIATQTNGCIIHLCSALYRTESIINEYNKNTFLFRNKDFGCEDLQICFVMAANGKIAYIPDITLYYGYRSTSVTNQKDEKAQFLFTKRITDLSFYLCKRYKLNSKTINLYFKKRLFALTMHAFRCKDKDLHKEIRKCSNNWHTPLPWQARAADVIMSNPVTWNLFLLIRKLFVTAKSIVRKH